MDLRSVSIDRLTGNKALATRVRIHESAMDLFVDRGYQGTRIADIAAAAGVSVRTVHVHYPSKEAIVFGEAEFSIDELSGHLAAGEINPLDAVRAWVAQSATGWLEPDVQFQQDLAEQVPAVANERARLSKLLEEALAVGFALEYERSLDDLTVRMSAAATVAALDQLERVAVARIRESGESPAAEELDGIIVTATRFLAAGSKAIR